MSAAASRSDDAGTILARADRQIHSHTADWRTLDPGRTQASTLEAIGAALLDTTRSDAAARAFADGLARIAAAMREAFPGNLFWDLDYLGAALWRQGEAAPDRLSAHAEAIASVQRTFGRHTPIGFAYVHDFTYGYDWAKWVSRDADTRAQVAPLSPQFVAVMRARGDELLAVIAEGADAKYPPLSDTGPRNPFGFSRDPADELRLHRELAARDELPVAAWRVDAQPDPARPYAQLRLDTAARLGLAR